MAYKIKAKLGKKVQFSHAYKSKKVAEKRILKMAEIYKDAREQEPKRYKKFMKSSKLPKFEIVKAREDERIVW